jgi:hypothetical protein
MNLLCKMGLHKWRSMPLNKLVDGPLVTERRDCDRCGLRQARGGGKWWFYGRIKIKTRKPPKAKE